MSKRKMPRWYVSERVFNGCRKISRERAQMLRRAYCRVVGHSESYVHPQQDRCICARCETLVWRKMQ